MVIMMQAELFQKQLNLTTSSEYFSGWYNKFKKYHGLCLMTLSGEKLSADHESVEEFTEHFE